MKAKFYWIAILLFGVLLLNSCSSEVRVGELRSDSQSVELGGAKDVRVEIDFGAGRLDLSGGAEKLLDAGFSYNVAELKPVVKYSGNKLVVRQPKNRGLPDVRRISEFKNDWDLSLYDEVPMDLTVNVGGGTSYLRLASLSLTRLNISQGAGTGTVDLTGNWEHDLNVSIDSGAAGLTLLLPSNMGVRVEIESGPSLIDAPGLTKDGNVYTNSAYGVSDATLRINMQPGIGWIHLEEVEAAALQDTSTNK